MKIEPGTYDIPEGYRVFVFLGARKIQIRPKVDRHVPASDHRCRDCKHQCYGWSTSGSGYVKVCELKVKKDNGYRKLYYAAQDLKFPCRDFEKRQEGEKIKTLVK